MVFCVPGRQSVSWLGLAGALAAQIPSHAVLLNPTVPFGSTRIARNGDVVHAVGGSLFYARSLDGGRTWPIREQPLPSVGLLGSLAVDGDHVHVVVDSGTLGPYLVSSYDGGTTWSLPVRVSQRPGTSSSTNAVLHVAGNTVLVAWSEVTPGAIWANRSLDGGFTWQADTRLDVGLPPAAGQNQVDLRLVAQGTTVHAFWTHDPFAPVTAYQRSLDGGATWLPAARVLASSSLVEAVGSAGALLAATSSLLLRSVDQGTTWTPVTGLSVGPIQDVAIEGMDVVIVGSTGQAPSTVILINSSTDGGATWRSIPLPIPTSRSLGSASVHVAAGARFVRLVFLDPGPPCTVMQTDDAGAHWRFPTLAALVDLVAGRDGCVVLTSNSLGSPDVQAWVLEGHTVHGQGSAGSGAIVPVLDGAGLAGLGRTFALDLTGARGGSPCAFFMTFGATANVPLGAATLYLQQPITGSWFTTGGTAGSAGAGTASLPLLVPANPWFAGRRLLSQAFVLDPGAVGGFCATRAVETWIH